jgi:hypothetical protein
VIGEEKKREKDEEEKEQTTKKTTSTNFEFSLFPIEFSLFFSLSNIKYN